MPPPPPPQCSMRLAPMCGASAKSASQFEGVNMQRDETPRHSGSALSGPGIGERLGWIAAGATALFVAAPVLAFAQDAPAPPTPDKGDTAWMLISTVLVLLMII